MTDSAVIPIVVPELGLPGEERVVVSSWLVRRGEEIIEGDRVVELLIGEMTFDVAAPATGRLIDRSVDVDQTVKTGTILGKIEPEE